jgi:hypothetical protein
MSVSSTIKTRNDLPKYSYFMVRMDTKRLLTSLPIQEYEIRYFVNPVTEKRGKDAIKGTGINEIIALTNEAYNNFSFSHIHYTNSKGEKLQLKYKDLNIVTITADSSRTEKMG